MSVGRKTADWALIKQVRREVVEFTNLVIVTSEVEMNSLNEDV